MSLLFFFIIYILFSFFLGTTGLFRKRLNFYFWILYVVLFYVHLFLLFYVHLYLLFYVHLYLLFYVHLY
ncbi:hypothetical protein H8356DRAFT_1745144 [Neocallimastix lanati (nom. inval.)]|nr:hypothetical protein H8356DRAFT_1745144 [Neocallimastix sp. JGI-2020a]